MVEGLLLDMDGVLALSFEPMPGAVDTLAWIKGQGIPFRIVTNTTTHTRAGLADTLRAGGFDVRADDIITAVVGTAAHLRRHHPGASVLLLTDGDAREDMDGVTVVGEGEPADVVVIGGAGDDFTYANLNHAFRLLMDGAALVAMHRNLYWRTANGLELDAGAYVAGLEEAANATATICGKPAPAFFDSGLELLGMPADRVAMVGDDIVNDVLGAQACGLRGVLVRTGKFMPSDLAKGRPDHDLDSFAELPSMLEAG
ncbi:MAG: TIGR01458 family HAD-type hydrolase [Actinobacteria bacterium]|nr:TIGR01458 family HAD-type hydrolase [Actinomycetota bacterium]